MFWFLVVLIGIAVYFHFHKDGCQPHKMVGSHQDALDILRARYARGEISSEEFNERKSALEGGVKS